MWEEKGRDAAKKKKKKDEEPENWVLFQRLLLINGNVIWGKLLLTTSCLKFLLK